MMARINIVEPMIVKTKNSIFRVEPINDSDGGVISYKATKIEMIRHSSLVAVEESVVGRDVYLEIGCRMLLGRLLTSFVVAVEYVEPHH